MQTLIGETVYVIDGIMYPGGESEYDEGLMSLRKLGSLEIQQDDTGADNGYVPYVWDDFSGSKQIFLKVLYVQLPETTRKGLVQPFRLVCKVKDPTIFSFETHTASTGSADFEQAEGTAIYSFEYPIIYGASTSSVSSNAYNSGDIPTYPLSIQVNGPVSSPKIINTTTGEYIELQGVNLSSSSDVLSIIYDKDSLSVTLNGNSVLDAVTNDSDYFKLQPGDNIITLTGASIDTDAVCEIGYYDAWPL